MAILHREFCIEPVASAWLRSALQLWDRMRKGSETAGGNRPRTLLGKAALDCVKVAQNVCSPRKSNWVSRFMDVLACLDEGGGDPSGRIATFVQEGGWTGPCLRPSSEHLSMAPLARIWQAWDVVVQQPWDGLLGNPRTAPSCSVYYDTYASWFAVGEGEAGPALYDQLTSRDPAMPRYVKCTAGVHAKWLIPLIRLRTGGHHLAVEVGRWSGLSREERVCTHCDREAVEDEMHVLFECPAYVGVRQAFSHKLFSLLGGIAETVSAVKHDGQFWRFMEQEPRHVAHYVYECFKVQQQIPAHGEGEHGNLGDDGGSEGAGSSSGSDASSSSDESASELLSSDFDVGWS